MTPEQKAKEIVEKYIKIIFGDLYFEYPHLKLKLQETAKACAIEEVKAVIKAFDEANAYGLLPSIEYYEKVLTEIEKL